MVSLSSELWSAIGRSKLVASQAPANVGFGERRSRSLGTGMEFGQHKDYEPGDDLRHLDQSVYSRHRKAVVKQFHVEQGVKVSVLLDSSSSMAVDPRSWQRAVEVAAILGTVALNGSDQVRFGLAASNTVKWGGMVSRGWQLQRETTRLASTVPAGHLGSMVDVAARSLNGLAAPGLLVVVSDWLLAGCAEALRAWRVRSQEVVGVQVLGGSEASGRGETGSLRLVDAETGEVVERDIDAATWNAYRSAVAGWSEKIRSEVLAVGGRWVSIPSARQLDRDFVTELRRIGLIT